MASAQQLQNFVKHGKTIYGAGLNYKYFKNPLITYTSYSMCCLFKSSNLLLYVHKYIYENIENHLHYIIIYLLNKK